MKEFDLNVVECKGTPRQMGRQYGEQAQEEIRDNVAFWGGGRLKANAGFLDNVLGVLGRFVPDALEEMEGIAEGAGVSLDSVLLMNHVNTFGEELASPGCTSFAISGGPDGPVLAFPGRSTCWWHRGRRVAMTTGYSICVTCPKPGEVLTMRTEP